MNRNRPTNFLFVLCLLVASQHRAQEAAAAQPSEPDWPSLPEKNGPVLIPAQPWPQKPGPREVRVLVHYPGGKLQNVGAETGVMLTLHNWGGTDCAGTASPTALAERYNVVALCVNYLQSGAQASIRDPEPYDFGYLQALDALRALYFVLRGAEESNRPLAKGRIFVTGGSGGGNVTLMATKLAPRTFACAIDLSGMAKLTDDIAFNLPGGSSLNARWSRDPRSPNYLSPDDQAIRNPGDPEHLKKMKALNCRTKLIVVHGTGDTTCPVSDARAMVAAMQEAGLDVEPHFITDDMVDGKPFTNIGHSLGNRTSIVFHTGDRYLKPGSQTALVRQSPSDFDLRDEQVRYQTPRGVFVISYKPGYPVGRFEKK